MKAMIRLGLVLFLITGISAGILGTVFALTKADIEKQKVLAKQEAQKAVLPLAKTFEEKKIDEKLSYSEGKDETGKVVGYTFVTEGKGYSSTVVSIVGVDTEGKIIGVKIINQSETPGLGAKAAEEGYLTQFKKIDASSVKVVPDGGQIKPITGATITPRAVCNSITETWAKIKSAIGKGDKVDTKQVAKSPCDDCDVKCTDEGKQRVDKGERDTKLTRKVQAPRKGGDRE
jgi:Na+-translocating ferredoxin:NAD+ oxidoreductase subunit G